MLWKGSIERHGLSTGARDVTEVPVTGFGGTTTRKQGRIQAMQLGKITVTEPAVGLNDYQYGDPSIFDDVVFDLPHDRLILERPAAQ